MCYATADGSACSRSRSRAGATVLFLAPGFYHGGTAGEEDPAEPGLPLGGVASERLTVDDLVNFVVGRAVDLIGLDVELVKRWGE